MPRVFAHQRHGKYLAAVVRAHGSSPLGVTRPFWMMTPTLVVMTACSSALVRALMVAPPPPPRLSTLRFATHQSDVVAPETVEESPDDDRVGPISTEWELDCFSRPVLVDGKKLWEVLITDTTGQCVVCRL